MKDETYEGYANYQTWNVSLWVKNDEMLNSVAREAKDYNDFTDIAKYLGITKTPDDISFTSFKLDTSALDELIRDTNE